MVKLTSLGRESTSKIAGDPPKKQALIQACNFLESGASNIVPTTTVSFGASPTEDHHNKLRQLLSGIKTENQKLGDNNQQNASFISVVKTIETGSNQLLSLLDDLQ